MQRESGILLPISSLPSRYGIGCFSRSAYDFVDWLKKAGQTYWQILPLGPTGYGDSPYQSFSTYAGNPYFIDLEALIAEGVLTQAECEAADFGSDSGDVDYEKLYHARYPLLRTAFQRSRPEEDPDFLSFVSENDWWLSDYALFTAVKGRFNGAPWPAWDEGIRLRRPEALALYREELAEEIAFQQYLQYKFSQQWRSLKRYANSLGIRIIGDTPIYVAMDSADTWANPELFQLDENNTPTAVAGCPPDGFSAAGQLWGNPLYRWDYHKTTGYAWWITRLRYSFRTYDVLRIDHFRGFDEYFSIPYGESTARNGHWEKGPGMDLFRAVWSALGPQAMIAEDLGYVTESVRELVRESGIPGMKVLEFAFDSRDSGSARDYLPHNYPENCVVYTGTHDNETVMGWYQSIQPEERRLARAYLCDHYTPDALFYQPFVAAAMGSKARICVIPIQDWLGYDNRARINQPSTLGKNWRWRITDAELTEELCQEILASTLRYGRIEPQPAHTGVALDLTGCTDKAGLFRALENVLDWDDNWGHNLDALWDILTGEPLRNRSFTILRLRKYSPDSFTEYVDRMCSLFRDAEAEGALSLDVLFSD